MTDSIKQPQGSERRVHPRYDYSAQCSLTIAQQLKIMGQVNNISRGGAYVSLDIHCPENYHTMPMRLAFNAENGNSNITLEAECKIVRADDGGLGLIFSEEDLKQIHNLIDQIESNAA